MNSEKHMLKNTRISLHEPLSACWWCFTCKFFGPLRQGLLIIQKRCQMVRTTVYFNFLSILSWERIIAFPFGKRRGENDGLELWRNIITDLKIHGNKANSWTYKSFWIHSFVTLYQYYIVDLYLEDQRAKSNARPYTYLPI